MSRRKAEFILSNAVDAQDYARAVAEVRAWGLDPDANVLFSAAYRQDAGVRRLWDTPRITLLTSEDAGAEARGSLATADQLGLEARLEPMQVEPARTLDPALRKDVELREKDWPILGGALAAGATHLITGDLRDFGPFMGQVVLGVLVLAPGQRPICSLAGLDSMLSQPEIRDEDEARDIEGAKYLLVVAGQPLREEDVEVGSTV